MALEIMAMTLSVLAIIIIPTLISYINLKNRMVILETELEHKKEIIKEIVNGHKELLCHLNDLNVKIEKLTSKIQED